MLRWKNLERATIDFIMERDKIYVNGRFLTQKPTGVQRFAIDLLLAIKGDFNIEILTPDIPFDSSALGSFTIHKLKGGIGYYWEQITLPKFVNKKGKKLLNLCNTAPLLGRSNFITIHDLAFYNKDWVGFKFRLIYQFLIPRIVKRASGIFTVSESVKKELIKAYALDESKIGVLYNRVSNELKNANVTHVEGVEQPYFLTVGSLNPRKNHEWLINFFDKNINEKLVLVGKGGPQFKSIKLKSVKLIHIERCSSSELKWLYQNTKAYVNFSLYEGFGIPTLEAMYEGVPIICSNTPINREIGGDEVLYVNLEDEKGLKIALSKVKREKKRYNQCSKFDDFNVSEIMGEFL